MVNEFDIAVGIFLLVTAMIGMYRGFVESVFRFLGFIAAIVAAKIFYPVAAEYLKASTNIDESIYDWVKQRFVNLVENININSAGEAVMGNVTLPEGMLENLLDIDSIANYTKESIMSMANSVASSFTEIVISIICIVGIFILAKFVIFILMNVFDLITKLPVLKQFNGMLGFAFGLLKGLLIVYIIFAVLSIFIATDPDGYIALRTMNSMFAKYFYTDNIILIMIG